MRPAPVGIERNGTLLGGAAVSTGTSASLPCQLGVCLCCRCASLLSAGGSEERERGEGECPVHFGFLSEDMLLDVESIGAMG